MAVMRIDKAEQKQSAGGAEYVLVTFSNGGGMASCWDVNHFALLREAAETGRGLDILTSKSKNGRFTNIDMVKPADGGPGGAAPATGAGPGGGSAPAGSGASSSQPSGAGGPRQEASASGGGDVKRGEYLYSVTKSEADLRSDVLNHASRLWAAGCATAGVTFTAFMQSAEGYVMRGDKGSFDLILAPGTAFETVAKDVAK